MRDLHYKHWLTTKSWFDFIPRIRVWGDFSGTKSNNWFRRSIYGMCERSRQFQSVDPIDNQNSWAYTKCNNIDQFVDILSPSPSDSFYASVNDATICSLNVLASNGCQAVVLTNDVILLTEPLRAKYQWSLKLKSNAISYRKMNLKMLSVTGGLWSRPQHIKRARSKQTIYPLCVY